MKKFNKNWIKMSGNEEVINQEEEITKEETKMSFVKKYKDKLIIGGLTGLAFLIVSLLIANKISSDDADEELDDFVDEIDDPDVAAELELDDSVKTTVF